MSLTGPSTEREKIDFIQVTSLVLSIYILVALAIETFLKLKPETVDLLDKIDFIICFFFLFDFGLRFTRAKSKLQFMKWGWIDLISSIPFYGNFQWARVARVVRILRAFRSTKILIQFLFRDQRLGTLGTAVLIALVMMIFSSIAILNVETAPNSNIHNGEDALWWAFTTIATVGYGDKFPVTTEGRCVAVLLITSGVGLFGVYTAYIASLFVGKAEEKNDLHIKILIDEVRQLRSEIEQLRPAKGSVNVTNVLIGESESPVSQPL